jgi:hypothetical protein
MFMVQRFTDSDSTVESATSLHALDVVLRDSLSGATLVRVSEGELYASCTDQILAFVSDEPRSCTELARLSGINRKQVDHVLDRLVVNNAIVRWRMIVPGTFEPDTGARELCRRYWYTVVSTAVAS